VVILKIGLKTKIYNRKSYWLDFKHCIDNSGSSGNFALIGTNSSLLLIIIGLGWVNMGYYTIVRYKKSKKKIKSINFKTKNNMGLISLIVGGAMDANKAIKQNKAKNDDVMQIVNIHNKCTIELPSFLSQASKQNNDASLLYWNKTLDCGVTIIDEPMNEFTNTLAELRKKVPNFGKDKSLLENMASISLGNMFDLDKVEIGSRRDLTINGLKAITFEVWQKRTFLKDAGFHRFGFIEGRTTLYQIIVAVGGTSISKISNKFDCVIQSFKEL